MNIRLCHPFGNPNSYNAAISFLEGGMLRRFHTLLYSPLGSNRRMHPELPSSCVTTYPLRETIRLAATLLPGRWNGRRPGFVDWAKCGFDSSTSRAVVSGDDAVYCYEDSALSTFVRASEVGSQRVYELPVVHYRAWRQIVEAETGKDPSLTPFFRNLSEPGWKLERKDRELSCSNTIVVPTNFVRKSLEGSVQRDSRIVVVPYGADVSTRVKKWHSKEASRPIQYLFAGRLGPGKGVHVLMAALSRLPRQSYSLILAGSWEPGFETWVRGRYNVEYSWVGQIPQKQVLEICRQSDVFVFPSLAEGFGLVILEAMASGIPVITTDRTGGPEVIEHGQDGWIVPAGDVDALVGAFELVQEMQRFLPEIGAAARRKAELWNWGRYRRELRNSLAEIPTGVAAC